ncbi:putative GTPase activating protein [Trypanosoma grayi]|uniref:putative GTPase activating protein n=1 Tax=Trypanosoma grayi TaxID=71804 RepID=UPI0004F41DE0|nr:putative GTPase activating protein [Trypanosoma grayi]KEG13871.1 putative GTPase activating protein [Trypanosoma grayi]
MVFDAEKVRPLEDFVALTGLKATYAKGCYDRFGGYAPALASFAQSYTSLPEDYFEEKDRVVKNAGVINEELKLIYKKAREIKSALNVADDGVWAFYYTHQSVTKPLQQQQQHQQQKPANAFQFGASSNPSGQLFGFANGTGNNTTSSAPTSASLNFGFGPAPVTSSSSATAAVSVPPAFAGFGQPKKVTEETVKKAFHENEVKYCEPSHFTGPFFDMPLFWKEEVEGQCPLLNLNKGFLEENRDVLHKRLEVWAKKAAFFQKPVRYVEIGDDDEETVRVIIKDADRTFFHPEHRKKFVAFLNAMHHEFKAYGQAMSYLAGLCLLVLNEEETAAVLRFVSTTYIPGHWAAEAIGFASSAWVVESFMQRLFPDVAKHLEELKFWPDTYLQKILTGLCIHVLNFRELFEFLDLFMESGFKFLIKYCLAIVEHFRSDLLGIKTVNDANAVYEIMRLDSKVADLQDVRAILRRAPLMDLGEDGDNIDVIRMQVYDKHVAPRLQRAPKVEAFEPCEVCGERKPTWWNDDLGAVCSVCKEANSEITFTKF